MNSNDIIFINTLGIDTIRFIISCDTLYKWLDKNGLKVEDKISNTVINSFYQKELKSKMDFQIKAIKISSVNNLSGYAIIKLNDTTINLSKSNKKRKTWFAEVVFAGLRQPTKTIKKDTYDILAMFINRFKISTMDICVDGLNKKEISKSNKFFYQNLFKEYINNKKDINLYKSSFYINNPVANEDDTDIFVKILYYDKYQKEINQNNKKLSKKLIDWKRLEVTINISRYKLKDINIADYIYDISNIAKKCFGDIKFCTQYIYQKQIEILLNGYKRRYFDSL